MFFYYDQYHPSLLQFIAWVNVMTSYIEKNNNKLFKALKH